MPYLFDDEDNMPMFDYPWDVHNPTVYLTRAQEKAEESLPFSDPKPDDGCWNCEHFDDNGKCMKDWNNLDPSYYIPDRDDRSENEYCEDWERRDDHIGNNP